MITSGDDNTGVQKPGMALALSGGVRHILPINRTLCIFFFLAAAGAALPVQAQVPRPQVPAEVAVTPGSIDLVLLPGETRERELEIAR